MKISDWVEIDDAYRWKVAFTMSVIAKQALNWQSKADLKYDWTIFKFTFGGEFPYLLHSGWPLACAVLIDYYYYAGAYTPSSSEEQMGMFSVIIGN